MQEPFPMDREEKKEYQLEKLYERMEEQNGLIRSGEIRELGIDFRRVQTFVEEGKLVRVKNGYYTAKNTDFSEERLICALFSDGILTLESAAYYYGYLKNRPYHWKIAIDKNTSKARFKTDYPIVDPSYTEPSILKLGADTIEMDGGQIGIYSKERLICDVLKYEEKIDRRDFKEIAFSYIQDESKNVAKMMQYAEARRVQQKVRMMIGVWL